MNKFESYDDEMRYFLRDATPDERALWQAGVPVEYIDICIAHWPMRASAFDIAKLFQRPIDDKKLCRDDKEQP